MIKIGLAAGAALLVLTGCSGMGGDRMAGHHGGGHHAGGGNHHGGHYMMHHMGRVDANGDGMVSKDEFMKAQEAMFDRMKNQSGVIDLKAIREQAQARAAQRGQGGQGGHGGMGGCPMMQQKKSST